MPFLPPLTAAHAEARARGRGGAERRTAARRAGVLAGTVVAGTVVAGTVATFLLAGFSPAVATNGPAGLTELRASLQQGGIVSMATARSGADLETRRGPASDGSEPSFSTNWSGMGDTGTGIEGAKGTWIVPSVATSASGSYSSSWVGVDGLTDADLIQTGTEQDAPHGYYAWWEVLPQQAIRIVNAQGRPEPVRPGDHISASVAETTPGKWMISIQDSTQHWSYAQNHYYGGPGTSAEWIEEAPTVNGVQAALSNFGTTDFSSTAVAATVGGNWAWQATRMTAANEIIMLNAGETKIVAIPKGLSGASTGQSFSDKYVRAALAPTRVRVSARVRSAKVSWKAPANSGGTPVVSYRVREYRGGVLQRTITAKNPSVTVRSLSPSARWSFSVAAHTSGNYTSAWSTRSVTVRPEG